MKAKELMVGDYLMHNGFPYRVIQVDGIVRDGWMIENGEEDCGEPIPLTPEILEKNGWIKTKYAYCRDCMEIHGTDELPEGVDNALSMARWSIDKNFQYHFLELYMWKGSVMKHSVHYVHQLQQAMRLMGCDKEIEL